MPFVCLNFSAGCVAGCPHAASPRRKTREELCHFAADQDEKVQPDSRPRRLFTRFERNLHNRRDSSPSGVVKSSLTGLKPSLLRGLSGEHFTQHKLLPLLVRPASTPMAISHL